MGGDFAVPKKHRLRGRDWRQQTAVYGTKAKSHRRFVASDYEKTS
jgi:hypothetical protein